MLRFMGSQRLGHDCATELTEHEVTSVSFFSGKLSPLMCLNAKPLSPLSTPLASFL